MQPWYYVTDHAFFTCFGSLVAILIGAVLLQRALAWVAGQDLSYRDAFNTTLIAFTAAAVLELGVGALYRSTLARMDTSRVTLISVELGLAVAVINFVIFVAFVQRRHHLTRGRAALVVSTVYGMVLGGVVLFFCLILVLVYGSALYM